MTRLLSDSAEQTIEYGMRIGKSLQPGDIVAFKGDLGAGKTTLIKGIARALGINEDITSPSYTIVSEYEAAVPLYHMDMYRIEGIEEFELLGVDELLFGTGISLIEWSERIREYLPESCKEINVTIGKDMQRQIDITGITI